MQFLYWSFLLHYSSMLATSSISGANCLMVFSTPSFMVEKLTGHPEQLPNNFTRTLLSFTSISSISPPSLFKNGRMLSSASITLVTVSSCCMFVFMYAVCGLCNIQISCHFVFEDVFKNILAYFKLYFAFVFISKNFPSFIEKRSLIFLENSQPLW